MTTTMEKLEKKIAEGFEVIRLCVHSKVGESRTLCPVTSPYYQDLGDRAKRLLVDVDKLEAAVEEFMKAKTAPPDESRQGTPPVDEPAGDRQFGDGRVELPKDKPPDKPPPEGAGEAKEPQEPEVIDAQFEELKPGEQAPLALPGPKVQQVSSRDQVVEELFRIVGYRFDDAFRFGDKLLTVRDGDELYNLEFSKALAALENIPDRAGLDAVRTAVKGSLKPQPKPGRPAGEPAKKRARSKAGSGSRRKRRETPGSGNGSQKAAEIGGV